MISQTYELEMVPGGVPQRVHVSQYDAGSRSLVFDLYAGGAPFSVPQDASVICEGTRPDRRGFTVPATAEGSRVTLELEDRMAAVAGAVECQLTVQREEAVLGSGNFLLMVEAAAMKKGTSQAVSIPSTLPFTEGAVLTTARLGEAVFDGQARPVNLKKLQELAEELQGLLSRGVPVFTPAALGERTLLFRVTTVTGPNAAGDWELLYGPIPLEGALQIPTVRISGTEETLTAALETEGLRHWVGTLAEYQAMEAHDGGTVYLIAEAST